MSANLCRCGGGRAHHENDLACWCPACLKNQPLDRCTEFAPRVPIRLPRPPKSEGRPTSSASPSVASPPQPPAASSVSIEVLNHIAGAGSHGATPGEVATFLELGRQATALAFKELAADGRINMREAPRKIGSEREAVWVAEEASAPQQITLWA